MPPSRDGRQGGFTLLEAVVALLVVGLAVGGALQAASHSLAGRAAAARHAEAVALAETRLNALTLVPADSLDDLGGRGWRPIELGGRRYRRRSTARPDGDDGRLWRVVTEVAWDGGRVELATVVRVPSGGGVRGRP